MFERRWRFKAVPGRERESFRQAFADEYEALDRRCEALTIEEEEQWQSES